MFSRLQKYIKKLRIQTLYPKKLCNKNAKEATGTHEIKASHGNPTILGLYINNV